MNEQINQLYQQALEFAYKNVNKEIWNTDNFHAIVAGKFAELIVRECIWALWTEECRTSDLASEEYTRGSNKIKEHFGVEE